MRNLLFLHIFIFIGLRMISNPLDTSYYRFYSGDLIMRTYSSTDIFSIRQINQNDKTAIFKPNQSLSAGLGISYRWLVLSFGLTVADLTDNKIYGKSNESLFGLSASVGKHYLSVYLQEYKGFYIENYNELGIRQPSSGAFPNLPNLTMSNAILSYQYFVSGNRFSIAPYTTGNVVAIKSSGSLILGAAITRYSLKNDSAFVKDVTRFRNDFQINSLQSFAPFIMVGYGFNFVLTDDLAAILIANIGGGIERQNYMNKNSEDLIEINPSYRFEGFGGIMYNRTRYFFSLTSNVIMMRHQLVSSSFETTNNKIMLNFGYRLQFKKRPIWIGNKIGL